MITLNFKPWDKFHAEMDPKAFKRYLELVATESVGAFRRGSSGSTPGPSSPGRYPARVTSTLYNSVQSEVTGHEVTIGTNVFYATYLAHGTGRMAKRKMMNEALEEGMQRARKRLWFWVHWQKGSV